MKVKKSNQLYFNKDHEMVRKAVRNFVKKEIIPFEEKWDKQGKIPLHDLFKKMGDLGYLGIRYDTKYGGEGLVYWYETIFLEEISRVTALGITMAIMVQTNMAKGPEFKRKRERKSLKLFQKDILWDCKCFFRDNV